MNSPVDAPTIVIDAVIDDQEQREPDQKAGYLKIDNREHRRSKSVDLDRILPWGQNLNSTPEKDVLLISDDEEVSKEKGRKKLIKKFNNLLKRGSDSPKAVRSPRNSIDFGSALPSSHLSLSSSEDLSGSGSRRGSLFVQPDGTIQHTVEADDTLASVAARYKSTMPEMKSLNRLMSPLIYPGQILFVPDPTANPPETTSRRPSDSCYKIPSPLLMPAPPVLKQPLRTGRPSTPTKLGILNEEVFCTGRIRKKKSVFSGEVEYITGGEIDLPGLLTISSSDVRFDTYQPRSAEGVSNDVNTIIGLVKSKMSSASVLCSATFEYGDPFREINKGNQEEETRRVLVDIDDSEREGKDEPENQVHYLRLTLGRKTRLERPSIEALVQMCIPGPNYVEHFFKFQPKVSEQLQAFLRTHHSSKLDASMIHPSRSTSDDIKSNKMATTHVRRKLSVAELCNLPLPLLSDSSQIFIDGHVRVLREFLPPRFDGRPWQLAYSTWKHGFSLNTLYRCAERYQKEEVALIMIKDTSLQVFGCLLCGGIARSESFYGTGESFLFTFSPFFQIYPWSGKNEYFARGASDCFILGLSGKSIGLWIDEDLNRGSSNPCETFDNDILTTDSNFQILALEAWTFPIELFSSP